MNLTEAFKALNALTEETFSVSDDGIEKLSQFEDNDDLDDTLSIIDTEAETEEDLQDSYLGKVILDCCVCHSKLYKDKDDIKIDDEEDLANVGDECPYCASSDGYKIIGEVGKFEDSEDTEDSEDLNESFNLKRSRRLTESSNPEDFVIENGILKKYKGSDENVIIPNGVTRIGTHAFEFCDSLTSITIPNSVESIGDNAFNHCTSLKSITIGNSVKTIGDSAFYYCNSLTNVTIPNSVTAIRDDAFCYCDSLINVTIPNSVKSIGDKAFAGCDSLKSVTISDGITSIGDYAFYDCDSLSDITFKGNVNKINFGKKCFYGTPVEKELFKDNDADASAESDDDEVDEALNEGIFGSKSQDYKGFTIQKQKGQFKITGVPSNSDVSVEEVRPYSAKSFDDMKRIIDTKVLAQLSDADKSRISKEREMQAAAAEHRLDKGESDARNYQQELKDRKRHSIERELDRNRKPVKNNRQYNAVTDRYSESVDEAVATLDRPMSAIGGTLSNVMADHSDELANVYDKSSAISFLDAIEPEVKNKRYLASIKDKVARIPDSRAAMFLYNIILKGDGMGRENESLNKSKSIKEDVNNVNVETDDSIVNVNTDDDGKVTVTTEPKVSDAEPSNEVIVPVTDETQSTIENGADPVEDDIDVDVDEFDEDSFDDLGESYFRKIYENVNRYKTTKVTSKGNSLVVEGLLKFKSGKTKKTSFIFEAKDYMRNGKARFIGENLQLTKGKKSFIVDGIIKDKKFISESFKYNYKASDNAGNKRDVRGSIKR